MYATLDQSPQFAPSVIVRTSGAAASVMAGLKAAAIEVDPNQPLTEMRTVEDIRNESLGADRLRTWLVAAFSGIALLLAGIGIFGVIAYSVAQRTHEIGVRAALGASRGRVMALVIRHALLLTAAGLALGIAGAVAGTRFMSSLLFGVQPNDLVSMAAAVLALGIVGLLRGVDSGPPRRGGRSAGRAADGVNTVQGSRVQGSRFRVHSREPLNLEPDEP